MNGSKIKSWQRGLGKILGIIYFYSDEISLALNGGNFLLQKPLSLMNWAVCDVLYNGWGGYRYYINTAFRLGPLPGLKQARVREQMWSSKLRTERQSGESGRWGIVSWLFQGGFVQIKTVTPLHQLKRKGQTPMECMFHDWRAMKPLSPKKCPKHSKFRRKYRQRKGCLHINTHLHTSR